MFGESFQSGFWHRIHGEGPGKGLNVQDVGGFGVLGSSAGPEKALGTGAGVQDAHPPWRVKQSAVSLIGLSGDGDAKLVAQTLRYFVRYRNIPATDEQRCHRADIGIQPSGDAPFDASQVCLGGRDILCAREQEGYVDGYARKDCLLNRWEALACTGDLDEEIGPFRAGVESLGRSEGAGRVAGQQGRDLQRYPAVNTIRPVVDREEEIGGLPEVIDRQFKEESLARFAFFQFLADGIVIVVTVLDGVIEDRGVR